VKILVSTKLSQGYRKNDYCWVPDDEPVRFGSECDGEAIDGTCGCRRGMAGVRCNKSTTTMRVVNTTMDAATYHAMIRDSLVSGGWAKTLTPAELNNWVMEEASELLRIAEDFPLGVVLEKRGRSIQMRILK
jgi:hypothetical protein